MYLQYIYMYLSTYIYIYMYIYVYIQTRGQLASLTISISRREYGILTGVRICKFLTWNLPYTRLASLQGPLFQYRFFVFLCSGQPSRFMPNHSKFSQQFIRFFFNTQVLGDKDIAQGFQRDQIFGLLRSLTILLFFATLEQPSKSGQPGGEFGQRHVTMQRENDYTWLVKGISSSVLYCWF